MKQIAFCHEQVEFTFIADKKNVFKVPKQESVGTQQRRLQTLFGKDFSQAALEINYEEFGFRVEGWVGNSHYHRPRADLQFFTLNQRVIRDQALLHAMRVAYDGKIPEGRYPAFALDLRVPFDEVDVNVHPTKSQVRFSEPRRIHDQLYSFVSRILAHDAPLLMDTNEEETSTGTARANIYQDYNQRTVANGRQSHFIAEAAPRKNIYPNSVNLFAADTSAVEKFVGVLAEQFAVLSVDGEINIVDLNRFLASIFAQRLLQDRRTRPLILPQSIDDNLNAYYEREWDKLRACGLSIEAIGPAQFVLREVPVVLPPLDYAKFLVSLADRDSPETVQNIATAAAISIELPLDMKAQQRWFTELSDQAHSLGAEWRQFTLEKSAQQWRDFLTA